MLWHGCAIPCLSPLEPVPLAERLPRLAVVIAALATKRQPSVDEPDLNVVVGELGDRSRRPWPMPLR
jgi:hypothetical protein